MTLRAFIESLPCLCHEELAPSIDECDRCTLLRSNLDCPCCGYPNCGHYHDNTGKLKNLKTGSEPEKDTKR